MRVRTESSTWEFDAETMIATRYPGRGRDPRSPYEVSSLPGDELSLALSVYPNPIVGGRMRVECRGGLWFVTTPVVEVTDGEVAA